jgi:error-prone DNA polymerase
MTSGAWLRRLTFDGAFERYGGPPPADVEAQLERELAVIDALDYGGYFLTMWEIVRYCREHGILCQGRGSAANSAVCFCLGITAVDPVRMGLLFERFLSRERAEPPDIDLDIAHERREEVIQHVYEKYGREHAAMVANVIRYRPKSAVRDVGKVLDIPATALDRLAKLLSHHAAPTEDVLASAGLEMDAPVNGHLLRLATELLDFPRHLSIHPGGFLLGHEPVHTLVPIENATMPGRTVIQWDKDDIDALGLFKVDLLGLGALTHIDKCFDLLEAHRGMRLDLASIPADDEDTYDMICDADTVGVFQIESRAQMAMLPRLRPRTFHDLVVEVSIVRPGPISGDMVHPYLRRREGLEEVVYPHPILIPVLERTLGVPLFQEQVMKLAVVAADYTPGEADQLRRDMAAWRSRGRIDQHHERLVARMVEKGIAAEFAERVFEQIRGFGEYGFPESHAASFALLSYATSYLRCHFLPEFVCALLNAQPMGFYSSATIIEDARRHGLEVRPMDVGCSRWDCTLEPAPQPTPGHQPFALRLGARTLKGMRRDDWEAVEAARPFEGVDALVAQTGLSRRALRLLAESGALESIAPGRREALWSVLGAIPEREASLAVRDKGSSGPLFESLDLMDTISWDYRTSALSALGHPLGAIREALAEAGLPDARAVSELPDGRRIHYAGLAICRQRPTTAGGAVFMTLEDESGFVNLVIWEQVFEQHSLLIRTASFMGVTGRVQAQGGVTHVVVEQVWEPAASLRTPAPRSRDFH